MCEDVGDLLPSRVQAGEQHSAPITRYHLNKVYIKWCIVIHIYYKQFQKILKAAALSPETLLKVEKHMDEIKE